MPSRKCFVPPCVTTPSLPRSGQLGAMEIHLSSRRATSRERAMSSCEDRRIDRGELGNQRMTKRHPFSLGLGQRQCHA